MLGQQGIGTHGMETIFHKAAAWGKGGQCSSAGIVAGRHRRLVGSFRHVWVRRCSSTGWQQHDNNTGRQWRWQKKAGAGTCQVAEPVRPAHLAARWGCVQPVHYWVQWLGSNHWLQAGAAGAGGQWGWQAGIAQLKAGQAHMLGRHGAAGHHSLTATWRLVV